jgi:hypothetical protein
MQQRLIEDDGLARFQRNGAEVCAHFGMKVSERVGQRGRTQRIAETVTSCDYLHGSVAFVRVLQCTPDGDRAEPRFIHHRPILMDGHFALRPGRFAQKATTQFFYGMK